MKIRRIVGMSMEPTYHEGQMVIFKRSKKYKSGDVVMVIVDGREVIKRISATSENSVYLVGDNLVNSTDSRQYGSISTKQVYGKAIYTLPFTVKQ
jgi:phage repressor protein C with HTH and peptisase S24 domain